MHNRRILFASTKAPFPARGGVTVPTSSYVKGFRELGYELDLLVLDDLMGGDSLHEDNNRCFDHVDYCVVTRYRGAELLKFIMKTRYPYFAALRGSSEMHCEAFKRTYGWIWVSPRRALGPVLQFKADGLLPDAKIIGAVNDVESLRLEKMSRQRFSRPSRPLISLLLKPLHELSAEAEEHRYSLNAIFG